MTVEGPYAYVASGAGLHVVDVSDPYAPRYTGTAEAPGAYWDLAVSDGYVYVAPGADCGGMYVVDVATPNAPRFVGGMTNASCTSVAVANGYAYTGFWSEFKVLPMQCGPGSGVSVREQVPGLLRAYPNPVSRQASLRVALPTACRVHVSIHDVAGRLVRSLHRGVMSPGVHHLPWDSCDEAGREVAPGVYLARVATSGGAKTARVVVLR